MGMLANAVVIKILWHINVSKQHTIHLKHNVLCKLYLNKAGKKQITIQAIGIAYMAAA